MTGNYFLSPMREERTFLPRIISKKIGTWHILGLACGTVRGRESRSVRVAGTQRRHLLLQEAGVETGLALFAARPRMNRDRAGILAFNGGGIT